MKRLLFCVTTLSSIANAFSQMDVVDFRNGGITFPTPADRRVYTDFTHTTPLTDANFVAGLWYLPGMDVGLLSSPAAGVQTGRPFSFRGPTTPPATAGTWLVPAGVSSLFPLLGVHAGETSVLQVRVWNASKYSSFAGALVNGEYLVSCPFLYTIPPQGSSPDRYYMDNLRAFPDANCVPEPSVWAVAVLAGSLVMWSGRRRGR